MVDLGQVLFRLGKYDDSLAAYRESIKISSKSILRFPNSLSWQRDLAISHGNMGDVYAKQDQNEAALAQYNEYSKIIETLAVNNSSNTDWQREHAIGLSKIGHTLASLNKLDEALNHLRRSQRSWNS